MSGRRNNMPGFRLTLGFTVFYLATLVLLPLSGLVWKASALSLAQLWEVIASERALAAYRLSFGASFVAALLNVVFGGLVAWVLARYSFPGRRFIDAAVDLPFALPTAVAGIALTWVYSEHGWLGRYLVPLGLEIAFRPAGVVVALAFVGLPFVVRTVQPVLLELDPEVEEAAACLGASRWQTFRRVLFPRLVPALVAGFALAFARALGEYGSVVFISGNMPLRTEIAPLLIVGRLEQFDYAGATGIALALLVVSFVLLVGINAAQAWTRRRTGEEP
jgi:sulfate transport system permease protein